jgi:protein HOOK3
VNTFDLPHKISQWSQLEDGQILWKILADIDSDYFNGPLPENDRKSTENWIPRWQNCTDISMSHNKKKKG